jgi:multidrug resistance efflux pump
MTWSNRFRVALGLVVILALVAAFTLVLNRRITQVSSASASFEAESVELGTDYAGTVVDRFVKPGDAVTAGEPVISVQSQALAHDLAIGLVRADAAPFQVAPDGTMTFVAPSDGIVTTMHADLGAFVQSGGVLATIEQSESLYISAKFSLDPRDYERIAIGADVTLVLPNQQEIEGTVESIEVRTEANRAESVIRVASDELERGEQDGLMVPGAPVTASVQLRDDGVLAGVEQAAQEFLRKIGV